jgi:hypothetical protein
MRNSGESLLGRSLTPVLSGSKNCYSDHRSRSHMASVSVNHIRTYRRTCARPNSRRSRTASWCVSRICRQYAATELIQSRNRLGGNGSVGREPSTYPKQCCMHRSLHVTTIILYPLDQKALSKSPLSHPTRPGPRVSSRCLRDLDQCLVRP